MRQIYRGIILVIIVLISVKTYASNEGKVFHCNFKRFLDLQYYMDSQEFLQCVKQYKTINSDQEKFVYTQLKLSDETSWKHFQTYCHYPLVWLSNNIIKIAKEQPSRVVGENCVILSLTQNQGEDYQRALKYGLLNNMENPRSYNYKEYDKKKRILSSKAFREKSLQELEKTFPVEFRKGDLYLYEIICKRDYDLCYEGKVKRSRSLKIKRAFENLYSPGFLLFLSYGVFSHQLSVNSDYQTSARDINAFNSGLLAFLGVTGLSVKVLSSGYEGNAETSAIGVGLLSLPLGTVAGLAVSNYSQKYQSSPDKIRQNARVNSLGLLGLPALYFVISF